MPVSYTHLDVYKRQTYGDALTQPIPFSGLSEDEQSFIIMYRQMDDQQRRSMLELSLIHISRCIRTWSGRQRRKRSLFP